MTGGSGNALPVTFLLCALLVPLLLTYVFVLLGAPLFSSRYLILTLPAFYLIWASGVAWLAGRSWLPAAGVVLVFVVLNGARWWEAHGQGKRFHEDWRAAVAYLERRHEPGEPVIVLHDAPFRAVDYYRTEPMILASLEGGPDRPLDLGKAPPVPAGSRVWLLWAYFESGDLPTAEGWLNQRAALVSKAWLPGVTVSEYRAAGGIIPSN